MSQGTLRRMYIVWCDVLLKEDSLGLLTQKPRHENCHWLFIWFILFCRLSSKFHAILVPMQTPFPLPLIQQSVTEKENQFHILLLLLLSYSPLPLFCPLNQSFLVFSFSLIHNATVSSSPPSTSCIVHPQPYFFDSLRPFKGHHSMLFLLLVCSNLCSFPFSSINFLPIPL